MNHPGSVVKRYSLFLVSLLFAGIGISLIAKSNLGASAISSVPYVLSLAFPLSMGTFTFIANLTFIILQIIILRDKFPKSQYMQLIVVPLATVFIDLGMVLFASVNPQTYLAQIGTLLGGIFILSFGIFLQIKANAITNPAEGIVKAIATKTGKEFGDIKTGFDVSLVVLAIIISLIAFGNIQGVREGTLLAALLVGPMIKLFNKMFYAIKKRTTILSNEVR